MSLAGLVRDGRKDYGVDMDHVSLCYWSQEGMCRHPKIGNSPATSERCGQCAHFKPRKVAESGDLVESRKVKPFAQRAMSWVKAEVSMIADTPLQPAEYLLRLEVCNACPELKRAEEEDKLGWCTKCGCPEWSRSELTVKARMPKATCPLAMWNESSQRLPLTDTLRGAIHA